MAKAVKPTAPAKKAPRKAKRAPAKKLTHTERLDAIGAEVIMERIARCEFIHKIAESYGMSAGTLHNWLNARPELYVAARERQADQLVEDMLQIADDGRNDTYVDDDAGGYAKYLNNADITAENIPQLAHELLADIGGNEARTGEFWGDVFDQVHRDHPPTAARAIIIKLRDALVAFINKLIAASPKTGFKHGFDAKELVAVREHLVKMAKDSFVRNERARLGLPQLARDQGRGDVRYSQKNEDAAIDRPRETRFSLDRSQIDTAGNSLIQPVRDIQSLVDKFKAEFKGVSALNIRVVGSVDDIPARLRPSPYAEGVFHDDIGLIYLIADNMLTKGGQANTERALQVLAHETVGHYGLAQMMGSRFDGVLRTVMRVARDASVHDDVYEPGDPQYATVEAVRLRYPDASEIDVAQEVLARIAETDPGSSKLNYIRAIVRQWLRDVARAVGVGVQVTNDELNDLVALASAYMRTGKNLESETDPSGLVAASKKASDSSEHSGDSDNPHAETTNNALPLDVGRKASTLRGAAREYGRTGNSPTDFVTVDGTVKFGEITEDQSKAMRRQAGMIRLTNGEQNTDGSGHGVVHIESRHGESIRNAGYSSVEDFVFDAVHHIDAIWNPKATAQVVAIHAGRKGKVLFLELQKERDQYGDYYRVNSAFPADDNYMARKKKNEGWSELWHRYPVSVIASGAAGFVDQSPNAGEMTPTVSPQSDSTVSPADDGRKYSTARGATTGQPINQAWQSPDNLGAWDNFVRTMQDKLIDTKRVVAEIRKVGIAIKDNVDPYLQEVLYHGRTAKRVSDFADTELRPLLIEMHMRGIDRQVFEDYLWARHAAERNTQIAKVNPSMPDSGSGLSNAQAANILAGQAVTVGGRVIKIDPAKTAGYQALAKRIDAITNETTDTLVRYGLETQETVDSWRATYGHYVPLMRDMESDDNYSGAFGLGLGTGQGFSVKGSASKRAMGSERGVIDILANVAMQRERAIVRGEKNRVAQSMYGLAITAPNPEFWLPLNPDAQKAPSAVIAELVTLGLNPVDAANIANEPKQRYTDPKTGLVMERVNPQLRTRGDVLAVRINGKDRYVMFSSNERAQQMVRGLKNLDAEQLGLVMQKMAVVTRWFAAINTQFNPVFGLTNGVRDLGTGMLNLSSTELKGHQAEVFKNAFSALRGVYADLRDHRAGRAPTSKWALAFEEFANEGGQTGYRDMFQTSKERTDALMKELHDATKGKTLLTFSEARSPLFGWLSDYNTAIENAVRLSAYQAAKDQGMTKQQAASLAKNLTVNFNKKGLAATQLGAIYAFFNAAVQGTARIGTTMITDANGKPSLSAAGKKILYGGMMAGVLQAVMFAAAGYDDEEPPQFAREKNFIIPDLVFGSGKYVSIPYPMGFHVIPNIGRIATEFALGGFKKPGQRMVDMFSMILDGFNPIGGSSGGISQLLSPTVTDPLVALSENKDWTGKSIFKEDFNKMRPTPGWTRKKDSASTISNWLAYGTNYLTGGGKYEIGLLSPTPDQIDYLIGQATGGVGRETLKAWQFGSTLASGEEMPMYKIPVAGRFVGETTGQASETSKFYNNLKRIGAHKSALDEMGDAGDREARVVYIAEHPDAKLVKLAGEASSDLSDLKKRKRLLLEKDASPEKIKIIDMLITNYVKKANARLSEAR